MKRPLLTLFAACLAIPFATNAGTTKPEWKKTSECAVRTDLAAFYKSPAECWTIGRKGTTNTFGEYHEFHSNNQMILVSMYLAGHNTVWRKNDPKSALTAAGKFLEDENAVLTRAKEKTIPIKLWVKRARREDLKTDGYGDGCFAFTSSGGSKGGKSSYLLGVIACNKDGSPITLDQRATISQSIEIKHPLYKEPRNTF